MSRFARRPDEKSRKAGKPRRPTAQTKNRTRFGAVEGAWPTVFSRIGSNAVFFCDFLRKEGLKRMKLKIRVGDFQFYHSFFGRTTPRKTATPGISTSENAPILRNDIAKVFFRLGTVSRRRKQSPSIRSPWRETLPRFYPERRRKGIAQPFCRACDSYPLLFSTEKQRPRSTAEFSPQQRRVLALRSDFASNDASSRPFDASACLFRCFCIFSAPFAFEAFWQEAGIQDSNRHGLANTSGTGKNKSRTSRNKL